MKKDITTKEAIKTIAEDIAIYILKLDISNVEFIDKEFERIEKREADIVALCEIDAVRSILHLEIQNSNDKTMHRRMLRYYVEIAMEFPDLPVHQYVIYIGKEALTMKDHQQNVGLEYSYTLIDMHTIDCDELIAMNTPDALVLAILCDFKGRDEKSVLLEIAGRLKQLTGEDEHLFGKKFLMMEVLSDNRNFKKILEEVEEMLRNVTLEQLPSYAIGLRKGIEQGIEQGLKEGELKAAKIMINNYHVPVEQTAKELGLPLELLLEYLKEQS